MGSGSSLLRSHHDDDIEYNVDYNGPGVLKRIPDEVKPRQRLGRLGLRSVHSLGKAKQSSSLRSALSVDLEDPEVTRIKKDFDMYRLNKEQEFANMQRKVQKCEEENRRIRVELQTQSKTCRQLREQRDAAREGERQARIRAGAFETDRDKIQRNFKIFRETKESELQNLLKAKRELEAKLAKYGHPPLDDVETASKLELSLGLPGNGEWWTQMESEPSLGSTTQLHTSQTFRGPEFATDMMEVDGPYVNVNKEDWNQAAASLANILPAIPDSSQINTIRVYISAPPDVQKEVDILIQEYGPKLRKQCGHVGRFFNFIHMPCLAHETNSNWAPTIGHARNHQIEQASVFISFLAQSLTRFTESDINKGHLSSPGAKPAVFAFRAVSDKSKGSYLEVTELKRRIRDSGRVKIFENYENPRSGVELVYEKLVQIINIELSVTGGTDSDLLLDAPEALCGGCLWDVNQDTEQIEYLNGASRSACELGFEKHYDRLSAHVSAAGPLPPLLISAAPGTGKSLLLAKWIQLQQQRTNCGLVLYHFVGSKNSCNADPLVMIRRFTTQLLQYVSSIHPLPCDPVRLAEEFPKWLEKVSSKIPGGVVLVLDSADNFQNGESQLKWLLDPLPVDSRVIISVDEVTCPPSWRSWPNLRIGEFTNKNVKELLRAELATFGIGISAENENKVLTHCRNPQTTNPLYVVILASDLAHCSTASMTRANTDEKMEARLSLLLQGDTVGLYKTMLESGRQEVERCDPSQSLVVQALQLIYASRNGLSEAELFQVLPELTWNYWAPVVDALKDRHVLTLRSGLLMFAHRQSRQAVAELYLSGAESGERELQPHWTLLRNHFVKYTMPGDATYRVADELPWTTRQLGDKDGLYDCVLDLCLFVKLYCRGRCAELIGYWQYLGVDKISMSQAYCKAMKQMEGMVGQFNGLVTLPRIADVYEALGRFLKDLNLLVEALMPLQRALEIRETSLDPDHPTVGQSLHQIAGLYTLQGKLGTAEELYKQALEIFDGAYGSEHVLVARELDALALLYQKQGKHELAEPMHRRAVGMRRLAQTPRPAAGNLRSVEPLRRRALQLEELIMGADSADLARTLNEIGVLYYLQNNIDTAESYFKRSVEMREQLFGHAHPEVAQSLNNLAALYYDRKQYARAQPLYERALAIRRVHLAPDHASVASVIKHLGMLYKKMGLLDKATPLYGEMVSLRERAFGERHPSVATALVNQAVLHSQQGEHNEALPLYERALSIYEEGLGKTHPRVAETLKNLALLKFEQGDHETAAVLYKRATDINEAQGGPENGSTFPKAPSVKSSDDSASTLRNTHPLHMDDD